MQLAFQTRYLLLVIKLSSLVLIASGLGLELGNICAILTHSPTPTIAKFIFWLERLAISTHVVIGAIAAYYAPAKNKIPIIYGTYTFFVGTLGLLELFDFQDNRQ
ncbi:MAG: hypothetical protein F6K47_01455 [Symploca sp. SIO2E6]|nr:hypothetical protein [Symploca sp. SIO2E6]